MKKKPKAKPQWGGKRSNQTGRPKGTTKPESEKRLAVQLSLTAAERDRIDQAAHESGLTRSAFVIQAVGKCSSTGVVAWISYWRDN